MARNRISSCLNVVGFSTTRAPLDNRHSVMPNAVFAVVVAIVPAAGNRASSGWVDTVSTYAVVAVVSAALITAAILASVGSVARSLSGPLITTRRLRSGTHSFASA